MGIFENIAIHAATFPETRRRVYCKCYGGLSQACSGALSCPNECCALNFRHVVDAPVLLVRESGAYEVHLPDWGLLGELGRYGEIDAITYTPGDPLTRALKAALDVARSVPRKQRERRVGWHWHHPVALRIWEILVIMTGPNADIFAAAYAAR